MQTIKIELYYSQEYTLEENQEITTEFLNDLEQEFAEHLDTFHILDNLDTTISN